MGQVQTISRTEKALAVIRRHRRASAGPGDSCAPEIVIGARPATGVKLKVIALTARGSEHTEAFAEVPVEHPLQRLEADLRTIVVNVLVLHERHRPAEAREYRTAAQLGPEQIALAVESVETGVLIIDPFTAIGQFTGGEAAVCLLIARAAAIAGHIGPIGRRRQQIEGHIVPAGDDALGVFGIGVEEQMVAPDLQRAVTVELLIDLVALIPVAVVYGYHIIGERNLVGGALPVEGKTGRCGGEVIPLLAAVPVEPKIIRVGIRDGCPRTRFPRTGGTGHQGHEDKQNWDPGKPSSRAHFNSSLKLRSHSHTRTRTRRYHPAHAGTC